MDRMGDESHFLPVILITIKRIHLITAIIIHIGQKTLRTNRLLLDVIRVSLSFFWYSGTALVVIEVDPVNEATPVFASTYSSPNPDVDEDAATGTEVVDVCDSDSFLIKKYYDFLLITFIVVNYD